MTKKKRIHEKSAVVVRKITVKKIKNILGIMGWQVSACIVFITEYIINSCNFNIYQHT